MGEVPLDEDVFKILIATDNHLGYGERKPIIEQDSFRAFEEILQLAVKNDVDFLLLGGDLFHESQPSPYCMYRCSELLKKYCFGDKPVSIEFLSDQSEHFRHLKNPIVNYEDPNLNISLPIFSIHGNHDSPSGNQLVSALDIFSCSGLINYFGRWTDLSSVEVNPILLKKGVTKIALYGLSHIPDQRLARLFQENKVKMPRDEGDDYFNILVLHQNRAERGIKNYIPYNVIPSHINFVVWGHEHDCNIHPTQYTKDGPKICQPGSSVATSLSEGESTEKHVGLLQVYKDTYKFIPIRLKSVRPFIYDEIVLCKPGSDDYDMEDPKQQAINDVKAKVEIMIQTAMIKQEDSGNKPLLPLIKLVVKYHNESQVFNNIRLGHDFEAKVANPGEMFKLVNFTPKDRRRRGDGLDRIEDDEFDDSNITSVEDVVEQFFQNYSRGESMNVLSVKLMTKAVSRYVEVGDNYAMRVAFENQINKTVEKLIEQDPDFNDIEASLEIIRQERIRDEDKEVKELMKEFENQSRVPKTAEEIHISDDEVEVVESPPKPTRARGSRGAKGDRAGSSRTSTSRRRARAK